MALAFLGKKTGYYSCYILMVDLSVCVLILSRNYNKWLDVSLLVMLGLISYPLYLWHYPLIAFANILGLKFPFMAFFQLLLSIILGWLTFRFVETRARKIKTAVSLMVFAISVISIGLLAGFIKNAQGLPARPHIQSSVEKLKQLERMPATDANCEAIAKQAGINNREFYYCRSTTSAFDVPIVAIIGDSHAHVVFSGMSEVLKQKNMDTLLMSNTGCPSLLGGAMGKNKLSVESCRSMIRQIYSVLDKLPKLEKVIIVARGPIYYEEKGFGDIERYYAQQAPKYSSYYQNIEYYDPKRDYFSSLELSINYLISQGKQVYLVLENPELGFSPKSCVDRPYNIPKPDCRVSFEIYKTRMKIYRESIQAIKSKNNSLHLLDPAQFLCDGKWCYVQKNGELLYADDDHLSVFGSKFLAERLINQIIN